MMSGHDVWAGLRTCLGMMSGSLGTKMTGRGLRFRGMGTDSDMKGSKVTETWGHVIVIQTESQR